MQPRPTEVEIQHFPTGELNDADGVISVVRLCEFWVTDGEACGEDPLHSESVVGIGGGDAGGETEQPPGHVDIVDSTIHYQPAGSFGEFDKEACKVQQITTMYHRLSFDRQITIRTLIRCRIRYGCGTEGQMKGSPDGSYMSFVADLIR